jgi:hypothetical protein
MCDAVDRALELVSTRLPETQPAIRDWNDRLFVEAFTRAYRCLRAIRELACRGEAEDAAVLTRALVSLTLQYLWLVSTPDGDERQIRLHRLERKWAQERTRLGDEMEDLGYFPTDDRAEELRGHIDRFRARAVELEEAGIPTMPSERDIARQLDRDLEPQAPRFFELLYTRIYRPTSHVAHFGIGAALARFAGAPDADFRRLSLERIDEGGAAEALGLALTAYGALLDFSEPILRHGLAKDVAVLVSEAHTNAQAT